MAIGACVLLGVQMSMASISLRSINFFQSVSYDSYSHCSAKAFHFILAACTNSF
jgi:hypothetical protein